MIICVSIVDQHKPKGSGHVGTYHFEIDYPAGSHAGQIDLMAVDCPLENEHLIRPFLGRLLQADEIPDPIRGDGSAV